MKRPGRHSIVRMIALLLAWLVAGATLNVAVAWGLAYWVQPQWDSDTRDVMGYSREAMWSADHYEQFGQSGVMLTQDGWFRPGDVVIAEFADFLPHWSRLSLVVGADDYIVDTTLERAFGWPWLALTYQAPLALNFQKPLLANVATISNGIRLEAHDHLYGQFPLAIPLRPLWPGFAVNTLFYAGVLWVLFCGPFALRRMIRRRRGQCPHCAYPIGQSPVCTECGAPHDLRTGRV